MGILNPIIRWKLHLRRPQFRHGVAGLAALFLCHSPLARYAQASPSEYSLKAAFIFNFAKFVEWPESAFRLKGEFCIATLGRTPLDRELAALSGKSINGRSIVFRQLNTPEETAQCQVLFISRSELAKVERVLDLLKDLPVLTVADREDFCRKGGMLALEKEETRLVFDVNYRETQRAKLKVHSQLLRLARKIYGRP